MPAEPERTVEASGKAAASAPRPSKGSPMPAEPARLVEASGTTFGVHAARWLAGIGAVSLLATLMLSVLSSDELTPSDTSEANTYSVSAVGHRALAEVLSAVGLEVVVSRHRSAERASPKRALLLLEPLSDERELDRVTEMLAYTHAREIPTLIAMPRWRVESADRSKGWARRLQPADTELSEEVLLAVDRALGTNFYANVQFTHAEPAAAAWQGGRPYGVQLAEPQCLDAWPDYVNPVATAGACVLVGRLVGTHIYLLADAELLSTMGLGVADHAPMVVALLEEELGVKGVVFDEVAHGFERPRTVWQELFQFPLVLVTFHLALFGALALWTALFRFGRPLPLPPRVPAGKATLIANTATLLALGHHAGTGVKKYLEATLRQLARAFGLAPGLSPERRLEQLAALAERARLPHDLTAIAREVDALEDRRGRRAERRAQALALKIHQLKTEMLHGDRIGS